MPTTHKLIISTALPTLLYPMIMQIIKVFTKLKMDLKTIKIRIMDLRTYHGE